MPDKPIEGMTYRPRVDSRVERKVLAVRQCYMTHSPLEKAVGREWVRWAKEVLAAQQDAQAILNAQATKLEKARHTR